MDKKQPCDKAVQAAKLFSEGKSYNHIARILGLRDRSEARNKVAEGNRGDKR